MVTLTERTIMKSRSGVYSDTSENRRKHRVGQKYGSEKQPEDGEKTEKKETDPAKELEAVNKVIASINEGKLNLPAAEVMKLSEKKQKLEAAKKQAEKINAGVKAKDESGKTVQPQTIGGKWDKSSHEERWKIVGGTGSAHLLTRSWETLPDNARRVIKEKLSAKKESTDEERWKKLVSDMSDEDISKKLDELKGLRGHITSSQEKNLEKFLEVELKERNEKEKTSKKETEPKKEPENKKKSDEHNLTNEQKAKVTSFSDPKLYSELARNSEEKKDLISTLKNVGEVIKEKESKEAGTSGTFKFKNEYIEIVGSEVTTGLKKQKGKSQYLGMSGHKRWYGGGEQFVETEKTEKFSVFDEEKMNNLLSKLNGKKVGGGKIDEKVPSSVKIEQKTFHMKDVKSEPKQGENEESYTRVKFDDVPNSGKVNLKKYLSEKMKKSADEAWGDISKIDTKGLQKMEKGLVEDFNRQFDELPKSRRAEKLYSIMKVKSELEKRGKESQTTETEKKEDEEISLKTFENIAFESKDVYDFMDKVKDIKGVPSSVSEEFRNKYGYKNGKPLSVLQASAAFYNKFRNKRSGIDSLKGK